MKKSGVKNTLISLKRLLSQLKTHKKPYTVSGIMTSLANLFFNLVFAFTMMWVLAAIEQNDLSKVTSSLWLMLILFIALLLLLVISEYIFKVTLAKANGDLRKRLFSKICMLKVSWFETKHSGDTVSRLINDMQSAENAWGTKLINPIGAIISGIGSVIFMMILDWRIGLITLGVGFVSLFITTKFLNPLKKRSNKVQKSLGSVTESLIDILSSYKITRIFNLSNWILEKYKNATNTLYKDNMSKIKLQVKQNMVNEFFSNFSFIGIFILGGIFVVKGLLLFSTLMAVIQLSNGVLNMYWILSQTLATLQQSLAGSDRMMEVLESDEETIKTNYIQKNYVDAITITNANFSYLENSKIIEKLIVSIKEGETIALVGGSGSGKSTLFKLLLGFYNLDDGEISIFGNNIENNLYSIREKIAYVPQINYLFSGTIKENISYGKNNASDYEIEAAAKAAFAHEFIEQLPNGYDTIVGERGNQLSGGQRQRIAIARALIKNAPILLLDEATSSLDSQSETKVQKALDTLIKGRTSIIAAHRLSTIKHANTIIVLENGKIVEQGNHNDLLVKEGKYAYYYKLQFEHAKSLITKIISSIIVI